MNYLFGNIPFTQLVVFSIVGVLLLLIFNFLGRYIIPLLEKMSPLIDPWWQRTQIVSWLVYLVLFYSALLRSYTAMTLIFTFVVLGLGWDYWKNIFAGVLIKFVGQLKKGSFISTGMIVGTIQNINLARSELLNEKGELVIVPNQKLTQKIVTHLHKTHDVNICVFNVKTTPGQTLDDMYQLAYNCPYIAANQDIVVEKSDANECVIKATIIDNSFIDNASRYFANEAGSFGVSNKSL